jgi:uncharacterized protein
MTDTPAPAPTLTNVGTVPSKPRKLFVNLPISNLQASIVFFEQLGFTFNEQFTDATATSMLVGEDAYFMLMVKDRFAGFARKPLGNPGAEASAIFAITAESRDAVDALHATALEAGATDAAEPQDHGFMYVRSFYDLDGYHWELFWMDPSAIEG